MELVLNKDPLHPIDFSKSELWESFDNFLTVWDALHPWFEKKGYTLYPRDPACPYTTQPSDSEEYYASDQPIHPFAPTLRGSEYYRTFNTTVGLWAAVDKYNHDVVIKLVSSDSNELVVATKLSTEPMKSDPNNFIVPILDILKYNQGYSVIVMPRWSDMSVLSGQVFDSLATAFTFARNMLQALAFLHANGIVHRDLAFRNILVNYNGLARQIPPKSLIPTDNWEPRFALCDLDLAVIFAPDVPHSERVLRSEETGWGSVYYHPPDGTNGEATYDPFAFDVACMGGILCEAIGVIAQKVPLLAPFLDRMITPDIPSRYTASRALEAFHQIYATLDHDFLHRTGAPPFIDRCETWQKFDRWAGLPAAFVKKHVGPNGPVRPRRKKYRKNSDGSRSIIWVG